MIRSIFLRLLFCSASLAGASGQAFEPIDQWIEKIPYEQRMTLEHVSQNMLTSMFACLGYVLYGDKPMCIVATTEFSKIPDARTSYDSDIAELKWFDFLTGLNIEPQEKKYPFIECRKGFLRHLIFINREVFIKNVNSNISLFRYVLGRTLTAESLLDALLEKGDRFYDILKFNKALLGILLGYGTQNALLVSRDEDLTCELGDERSYFPFESYETFIGFQHVPSLGFSTIEQEHEKLRSLVQISTNIHDFDYCPIPHFGCDLSLKKTTNLLSLYKKNRKEIVKFVREGSCLNKLLTRLCTTVSGAIKEPQDLKKQIRQISYENDAALRKYIDCAASSLLEECKHPHFKEKSLVEAVLKGMKCAEEGGQCPTPDWRGDWCGGYSPEMIFERHRQNENGDRFLRKLAKQSGIVELIPKYVYHKVLVPSQGTSAPKNIKNVTFHFSLLSEGETLIDSGTIKKVELEKLIPGVAYSLVTMKKGEEREIYIHPKYAYESSSWQSRTVARTQIKLLDFEEGESEAALPRIGADLIEEERFQDFLNGYQKAKEAACFSSGYYFWKKIKELGIGLDLEEFSDRFRSESIHPSFQSEEEKREFILDFNCYLFTRKDPSSLGS